MSLKYYYNIHEAEKERYFSQIRFQTKTSGTVLPKVHGVDKGVDPNLWPEKTSSKATVYTSTITCSAWVKNLNSCKTHVK